MTERPAVVDTNCAISFYLGNKSEAHAAISDLRLYRTLLASNETLAEFREVLLRDKFERIPLSLRFSFIENYEQLVTVVEADISVNACIDPADDKFLGLALGGNASLLLTKDKHLLRLHPFHGVDILAPYEYLKSILK